MKLSEFEKAHSIVMRMMDENGSSEAIRNLVVSEFGDSMDDEELERLVALSLIVFASGFVTGCAQSEGADSEYEPDVVCTKEMFGYTVGQC